MDESELLLWRIERLQAAIDRMDGGNLTAFGKRLGFADGSYIGQMLRGSRPITEKFVRKLEEECSLPGWFETDTVHEGLEYQLRSELLARKIPDHVLQTMLEMIKHYPLRSKVA